MDGQGCPNKVTSEMNDINKANLVKTRRGTLHLEETVCTKDLALGGNALDNLEKRKGQEDLGKCVTRDRRGRPRARAFRTL